MFFLSEPQNPTGCSLKYKKINDCSNQDVYHAACWLADSGVSYTSDPLITPDPGNQGEMVGGLEGQGWAVAV